VKIWNPDIGSVRVMGEVKGSQITSTVKIRELRQTGCDLIRGSVIFKMLVQRCNGPRKISLSIVRLFFGVCGHVTPVLRGDR
jgi:hypothetical protein